MCSDASLYFSLGFRASGGGRTCLRWQKITSSSQTKPVKAAFIPSLSGCLPADVHGTLGWTRLSWRCRAEQRCHDSPDRKGIRAALRRPERGPGGCRHLKRARLAVIGQKRAARFGEEGGVGLEDAASGKNKSSHPYVWLKRLHLHQEVSELHTPQQKCECVCVLCVFVCVGGWGYYEICRRSLSARRYVLLAELHQSSPSVPAQPGHASVARCFPRLDADCPVGSRTGRRSRRLKSPPRPLPSSSSAQRA